ncbi:MAG: hypothetical protein RQM92_06505 [Candidatus Syntrophopropionicum ammoniitolerans]
MQPETNSLLNQEKQRQLLDRFAGKKALEVLEQANLLYTRWREAHKKYTELNRAAGERARRIDMLRYQIDDIQQANLDPGEDATLENEKNFLVNAEKISMLAADGCRFLSEGTGNQYSALDLLAKTVESLRDLVSFDNRNEPLLKALEDIFYQTEDIARELARYCEGVDFNPSRLAVVDERLEQIKKLKRKYGETIREIHNYQQEAKKELDQLENVDQSLEELLQEVQEIESAYNKAAGVLSATRRKMARELETAVKEELSYLEMGRVEFKVAFTDLDAPARDGLERVSFMIATNPENRLNTWPK